MQLIQDITTKAVYFYTGDLPPTGFVWFTAPMGHDDIVIPEGWWKPSGDTQMSEKGSCVGENADKVPCEVFSRVVGYITAAKVGDKARWNKGKFQEFKERATYSVPSEAALSG